MMQGHGKTVLTMALHKACGQSRGVVCRIIQDMDFQALPRVVETGHGLDQTFDDIALVIHRELDSDAGRMPCEAHLPGLLDEGIVLHHTAIGAAMQEEQHIVVQAIEEKNVRRAQVEEHETRQQHGQGHQEISLVAVQA
jgi:hypothetical protein